MGNQIAIMTHCGRGEEAICDAQAHVFHYEMAAASVLAGVQLYPIPDLHKDVGVSLLCDSIRAPLSYLPQTRLICLENTLNRGGGSVMPLELMAAVYRLAQKNELSVHLDGARIFNAAIALQCEVAEIAGFADSVMFCLSKGLGAPVGSILAGNNEFILQARRYRKLLGGGMRQAGVLAAAGLIALADTTHLANDHANARRLAKGLAKIPGLSVDIDNVVTNMVMAELTELPVQDFLTRIGAAGVAAGPMGRQSVRFVTHLDVTEADIDEALARISQAIA